MLYTEATQSCAAQARALNDVLGMCYAFFAAESDIMAQQKPGTLSCEDAEVDGSTYPTLVDLGGDASCQKTKTILNAAAREFRGPAGGDVALDCAFSKYLVDTASSSSSNNCSATVGTLNAMTEAYRAGGFQTCEVTTPTTTASEP